MKQKRGNKTGFMLFDLFLFIGIKHAYALLHFVCLYYLFFDRKTYRTTSKYVAKRFKNEHGIKKIYRVYKLMLTTGKNLVDLRQLEKRPEQVKFECNNEGIIKMLSKGQGLLMLTSHTGNWQIMMRKLPNFNVKVNIVMLPEENPAVSDFLKIDHGESYDFNLIDPGRGMEAVLEIMQELSSGNIVSIMADRTTNNDKNLDLTFFDKQINIPQGPFVIANSANAPILQMFINRNDSCSYALETAELSIDTSLKDKNARIKSLARQYINNIETYLTKTPYEWNATSMN